MQNLDSTRLRPTTLFSCYDLHTRPTAQPHGICSDNIRHFFWAHTAMDYPLLILGNDPRVDVQEALREKVMDKSINS